MGLRIVQIAPIDGVGQLQLTIDARLSSGLRLLQIFLDVFESLPLLLHLLLGLVKRLGSTLAAYPTGAGPYSACQQATFPMWRRIPPGVLRFVWVVEVPLPDFAELLAYIDSGVRISIFGNVGFGKRCAPLPSSRAGCGGILLEQGRLRSSELAQASELISSLSLLSSVSPLSSVSVSVSELALCTQSASVLLASTTSSMNPAACSSSRFTLLVALMRCPTQVLSHGILLSVRLASNQIAIRCILLASCKRPNS